MKLDWKKVLFVYVCKAMIGATCWVYCTWSFQGMWKGALVGVGLFTGFLGWVWVGEWWKNLRMGLKNLLCKYF